jgi:hypothetical protein
MPTLEDKKSDIGKRDVNGAPKGSLTLTDAELESIPRLRFDSKRQAFVISKDADPELISWVANG